MNRAKLSYALHRTKVVQKEIAAMLSVIINWIYVVVTAFLLGTAFSRLVRRWFKWEIGSCVEVLFFGLIFATVYAQIFSLFGGVGMLANGILIAFCIFAAVVWRKPAWEMLQRSIKESGRAHCLIAAALVFIWAYCTSRGYMHYDSDLYHAQSIRWIEEYGVVPGLGNIHVRFAYNSSFFALSALYSMAFLGGQSLHTVNGFFALLLSVEVLKAFRRNRFRMSDSQKSAGENGNGQTRIGRYGSGQKRLGKDADTAEGEKRFHLSDFARLGALYYLTILYRDIVAPASDYAVMCVVFLIVIRWLAHLEQKEKSIAPYALLCVAGVYAVTLKLTAGVILLLTVKPAYLLIKEKKYWQIAAYIAIGLVVLAPWILRTALISGYLLYPFPALDVLNVDWKIPAEAAARDAAEIKTWGRGFNDASLVGMPLSKWFPHWFSTMLPTLGKLFVAADLVCIALWLCLLTESVIRWKKKKTVQGEWDELLVLTGVVFSYVFWQLSAPLLRYGYAYVLLVIVLTAGVIYRKLHLPAVADRLLGASVVLFTAVKALTFVNYAVGVSDEPYYVAQQDYGTYELDSFMAEDVRFYIPKSGDRVGYESFPAIPAKGEILFRGGGIESGFRRK